jgi:translocator protein
MNQTGRTSWQDLGGLIRWLALVLVVAVIGGMVTGSSVTDWYPRLVQPAFAPPNAVFGPVWTALYVMMAFAAWRIWRVHGFRGAPWALGLFLVQMGLNLLWSILFFGFHQIGLALVEIVVLWLAILMTTVLFWRLDRIAGALLLPYLAWVGFAAVLNHAFWVLN